MNMKTQHGAKQYTCAIYCFPYRIQSLHFSGLFPKKLTSKNYFTWASLSAGFCSSFNNKCTSKRFEYVKNKFVISFAPPDFQGCVSL